MRHESRWSEGRATSTRVDAIDRLRGLIIVLMALDHTSAFVLGFPRVSEFWAVAFPRYDEWLLFVLRAVTHLCAPGFFLTMGAATGLAAKTGPTFDTRLAVRGALLIVLQLTVVNVAWLLSGQSIGAAPGTEGELLLYFGVLSALGAAMINLAGLRAWPSWAVAGVAAVLPVVVTLVMPSPDDGAASHPVWQRLLWIPGQTDAVFVRYPVLAWLPISLLGVLIGRGWATPRRQRWLIIGGGTAIAAFFVLRSVGEFGNLRPPEPGVIGFFNVVKYPPSLTFQLLTVGINLILLASLPTNRVLSGFGQSALFFYVVHLYLYGLLGRLLPDLGPTFGLTIGTAGTLVVWGVGLVALWPLCLWWRRIKHASPPTSWVRML